MKILKRLLFLLMFAAVAVNQVYAVKAKEGLMTVRQPDGNEIQIRMSGDEHSHTVLSSDGYLLTTDEEGYYVFAGLDAFGQVIPTDIRVTSPSIRTEKVKNEIAALDKEEILRKWTDGTSLGHKSPRRAPGLMSTYFPSSGVHRALVILVEFADRDFSTEDPHGFYTRMLNEAGFSDDGASGSARDYFIKNSSGVFSPSFDVYGPVKLPNNVAYYGANDRWGNDQNPQRMAIDACELLDDLIDFNIYDTNSDGIIDNVFFYYAGYGEADGGGANTIWPHSTRLSLFSNTKYKYDGVQLDRYACSNELQSSINKDNVDGIGTFCHEFCHVLGLPDLYATTTINLTTPGIWDLMDNGSYNNKGKTPPVLSSYERYALDWIQPVKLFRNDYLLPPLEESNMAFIIENESGNEYYLFENRQQQGFDTFLPGHGMLVWHVDYVPRIWENNMVNDNIWHQYVDLVEADNLSGNDSRQGDPFPGSQNVTAFTKWTSPSLSFWDHSEITFGLQNIYESDSGVVSFSVRSLYSSDDNEEELPEEEEIPEEETDGIDAVGTDYYFEIQGNRIINQIGELSVYDISGKMRLILSPGSSAQLYPGLYIAVKKGRRFKVLIGR